LASVIDALLLPESGPLKEKFLSGEEEGSVPADISEAVTVIVTRARHLVTESGQDGKIAPQNMALTVGLYCYGAVLCTEGYSEREFSELFRLCQSNLL